jgi:DNA repair protein RadC
MEDENRKTRRLNNKMSASDIIRERMRGAGVEALADFELVALLLERMPVSVAAAVLERAGGLDGLARKDLNDLAAVAGLGRAGAFRIKAAVELGRRLAVPAPPADRPISHASQVADWFRCRLQDLERECIHALLLDSKHRPLRHMRVTEGSWTSCNVDPKVVFSACLRNGAPAVILVHNHPSGDPSPSRDDLELTERMLRAGKVIGVRLLDHLIVGREGFTSLADAGLL